MSWSIVMQNQVKWAAVAIVGMINLWMGGARSIGAEAITVTVFKTGQDGYHTYRIPVIVRAKNGDLLAFAEGRKNSATDHGDIDIVLKRSSDEGKSWGPLQIVQ